MDGLKLESLEDLLDNRVRQSRSVWLRGVAAGTAPPQIKIGRSAAWIGHEVDAWIAARINGATDEQLRALVVELVKQRKQLTPASMRDTAAA